MYVIDTDVSIDYMRGDNTARKLLDSIQNAHLTTITLAELFFGANSINRPKTVESLKNYLQKFNFLPFQFWDAILFGKIKAGLKKKGTLVDDADIMIASVALSYDMILITRNAKDFKKIPGLKMIEP